MTDFDEFWAKYPPVGVSERRAGKKAALKAYTRARKEFSHSAIMACLGLMIETDWRTRKPEYIPHASTWLNRESFDDSRCEAIEDEAEHKYGDHCCTVCRPAHLWSETGDSINWDSRWEKTCPEQVSKMRNAIDSAIKSVAAQKSF